MAAGANAVTQMSLMAWPEHMFPIRQRHLGTVRNLGTMRNLGTVVEAKGNARRSSMTPELLAQPEIAPI